MALQVTFDAHDPHALARFYAAALDYELEDHHDMIGEVIAAGHVAADSDDIIEVDGRRAWRGYAAATAPDGSGRLLFQHDPRDKADKNRVHLDLHPEGGREAKVAQLLELGATKLWDGHLGPQEWETLADPEGNELCVADPGQM